MPDFGLYAGDTSKTIYLRLRDSTTGLGKTGLVFNSAGFTCSYTLPGAARAAITMITLASASAAWDSGGFILVDDTNAKGLYRLDLPNAAIASGAFTLISIEFDGIIEESMLIPLHTPAVNVTELGGVVQSLTDLKDFADAGYDPGTNKVQGVVLCDTTTTNTDMAGTDGALTDKAGFSLSATGLDLIASTATGMVEIAKAIWDRVLNGANHNVPSSAGRRLRNLQDFGLYEGGAVWIDTVNGTAGTTDFENGTVNNPVDSIADAKTLADSVGLVQFHTLPGSAFTLTVATSFDNYEFIGYGYTVTLNSDSVSGASFSNATIVGNDDGSNGTRTRYLNCTMGSNTLGAHQLLFCRLAGDIVIAEAADYFWDSCHSGVAGTGTPSVDLEAAAETKNLSIRHYSGGIEFKNFGNTGTHTASLEGHGQYVLNASCAGGTLAVRGHFGRTDNAGGAVTMSDRVNFETLLDDGTTTYDRTTDSLQEIKDHAATIKAETVLIVEDTGTTIPGTITTAQADLDTITGADGANLLSGTQASIDAIEADTNELQTDDVPTLIATAQTAIDAIKAITDAMGATAAANFALALGAAGVVANTAKAGTLSVTQMSTNLTQATDDHYIGRAIVWTDGALLGQASDITDYVGVNGVLTFTAVTDIPGAGDAFIII